jgi:hypothetical protein
MELHSNMLTTPMLTAGSRVELHSNGANPNSTGELQQRAPQQQGGAATSCIPTAGGSCGCDCMHQNESTLQGQLHGAPLPTLGACGSATSSFGSSPAVVCDVTVTNAVAESMVSATNQYIRWLASCVGQNPRWERTVRRSIWSSREECY